MSSKTIRSALALTAASLMSACTTYETVVLQRGEEMGAETKVPPAQIKGKNGENQPYTMLPANPPVPGPR